VRCAACGTPRCHAHPYHHLKDYCIADTTYPDTPRRTVQHVIPPHL
jgi:hypothetical protein